MAEDSTRKLLKVFGVSVTDCEDALAALREALADPSGARVPEALDAYGKAARELAVRWAEVSRLVLDYQLRAHEALAGRIRGRGGT
jgi:hypothetical protein